MRPKIEPIEFKQWHVVAAVSRENGLENFMIHKRSVNSEKFLRIIPGIKRNGNHFVLFGDNASWHHSFKTRDRLYNENIEYIANIVCYPIFNAIERVFFFVKIKTEQAYDVHEHFSPAECGLYEDHAVVPIARSEL